MNCKAIGRSAWIIVAGLCVWLWGPLQPTPAAAAPAAAQDSAAPVVKKRTARHHTRQVKKKAAPSKAAKPTAEKAKDESKLDSAAAPAEPNPDGAPQSLAPTAMATPSAALPASVANANAQIPAEGATPGASKAPEASPTADAQVIPPDEINELDRAAVDTPPAVMAGAAPAAATVPGPTTVGAAQVSSATSNDGAWDKASLIGKIFIAAGGLLTLASAARMFMA
ncbi:MAG: hypothetical protein HZA66_13615 [Rhodopseudomonas palustris]|uniref:Uncharacterized protein n=1 Tax=Rhodopseudomonas palustris TaxID=1076 RepID=A0A933W1Y6_RHOPL|nr:hypothetical protein [Rhodopseudomonas palustris]